MSRGKHGAVAARRRETEKDHEIESLRQDNKRLTRELAVQKRIADNAPRLDERIRILEMNLALATNDEIRTLTDELVSERKERADELDFFAGVVGKLLDQLPEVDPTVVTADTVTVGLNTREWHGLRVHLGERLGVVLGRSRRESRDFAYVDPDAWRHNMEKSQDKTLRMIHGMARDGNPDALAIMDRLTRKEHE